jgi:Subtilase family
MSWPPALARWTMLCVLLIAASGSILLGQEHEPGVRPAAVLGFAPCSYKDWLSDSREEALARLGVDIWHQAGHRAQGTKVAILDSGFHEYQSFLGKVLPASVTVRSFRTDGNLEARDSQHGILCGEVIHALAPDASLLFVNWEPDRPETLLEAVRWAKSQGVKVLSCSLVMPSWSDGEGGGTVHEALSNLIGDGSGAADMLFFASAGNLAQRHWSGPFQPDDTSYHQWIPGHRNNSVTPWGDERVSVELYGRACEGIELQVNDSSSGKVVGRCRASCEGSPCGVPCAVVAFQPTLGSQYYVRLRKMSGVRSPESDVKTDLFDFGHRTPDTGRSNFHLAVLGGTLHYTTANGSIPFPADGPAVRAVGAVDNDGRRLSYSSCGPNSRLPKPDFVAEVPFPSLWRDRPFTGTSAAAPQAAALAALVWARHPQWSARQVGQELRRASFDLGPMGHDWETGHGLLRLPARVGS